MTGRLCILAVLLLLLLAPTSSARTWFINAEGTGDAPTIAAAIDSAALADDVIELADDIYTGPGNRDLPGATKTFILRSASDDPTACIIDLEGSADERHVGFSFSGDG